jgi:hypothetical protein
MILVKQLLCETFIVILYIVECMYIIPSHNVSTLQYIPNNTMIMAIYFSYIKADKNNECQKYKLVFY